MIGDAVEGWWGGVGDPGRGVVVHAIILAVRGVYDGGKRELGGL